MKKSVLLGVITIFLITLLGTGIAMANGAEKRPCDDWHAASCLYTPSGNIHVWHGGNHAICVPMERFNEKALEKKMANGWYESTSKEGYICRWNYQPE